jgi:hypothetical protein
MHKPNNWTIVSEREDIVILSASCACGDGECNWIMSSYICADQTTRGNLTNTLGSGKWRNPDGTIGG